MELQMINREFESLSKLDNPMICELLELFIDSKFTYFVYPFYTGGELHDLLPDYSSIDSDNEIYFTQVAVPEKDIKHIVYQILRVMNYLSKNNIIHRDLKLENFMFESKFDLGSSLENNSFIKLIDFGYSLDLNKNLS